MQVRVTRRDDPTDRGFGAFDLSFTASASLGAGGGGGDPAAAREVVTAAAPMGVVGGPAASPASGVDWGHVYDAIAAFWHSYADSLGGVAEPGIDDFASAIDAVRGQIAAFDESRKRDQSAFLSVVGTFFGDTGRGVFGKVFAFAASIGRDPSYDPALLEQAAACTSALRAEGWPLWPAMSRDLGEQISPAAVRKVYCETLANWRSLAPSRAASIRSLWRAFVASSGDPEVAFVARFAYAPAPGGTSPVAYVAKGDLIDPPIRHDDPHAYTAPALWCVFCSVVAARSRNVSSRDVAIRALPIVFTDFVQLVDRGGYYEAPAIGGRRDLDVTADVARLTSDIAEGMASGGKYAISPAHRALSEATPKARATSGAAVVAVSAGAGVLGYGLFRIVRALADARRLSKRKDR